MLLKHNSSQDVPLTIQMQSIDSKTGLQTVHKWHHLWYFWRCDIDECRIKKCNKMFWGLAERRGM